MGFKRSRVQIPPARFHVFTYGENGFLSIFICCFNHRWCPTGALKTRLKDGCPASQERAYSAF
jgi:hypothetical protein